MSVAIFQKLITYIRETQEVALYATMADARWYAAFGASPLFYVMLPFIGFLLTVNALFNAYHLVKASNRNFDKWFGFLASAICAVLGGISLYGAAISVFLGVSFAAGPWFFFGSLITASVHQLTMLAINLHRAYESLAGSSQRMHHLQAALNNLFIIGLLASAFGSVLFVMLFPTVAPLVGIGCALSAVFFTATDIFWRMIPHNWKLAVKKFLHIDKPQVEQNVACKPEQSLKTVLNKEQNPNHHRLFTSFDYSTKVREMDVESAKDYLNHLIVRKINSYNSTQEQKIKDKIAILTKAQQMLGSKSPCSKQDLLKDHPLAFQSFWLEKGEVEQIVDAVFAFQEKCKQAKCVHAGLSIAY